MDVNALLAQIMSGINPGQEPLPPMQQEDAEHGYWDAQEMGNGRGQSFMMRNGKRMNADPVAGASTVDGMHQLAEFDQANGAGVDQAQLIAEFLAAMSGQR